MMQKHIAPIPKYKPTRKKSGKFSPSVKIPSPTAQARIAPITLNKTAIPLKRLVPILNSTLSSLTAHCYEIYSLFLYKPHNSAGQTL